ncbi:MAG: hypothetical protein K8L97_07235 [Anaerolineae bacterium]|nr:hypothetical protein [Anaerolineae bacterium]
MVNTAPIRGNFPSLKLGRIVHYGSTIERDLLYFLEFRESVTWYKEQPMLLERILEDGQRHRYTPDYEIHEGTIRSLAECKPIERFNSKQAVQQRRIGQAWAEENGYRFVTFTDAELRAGHQLSNLKLLWRYARLRNQQTRQQILTQVRRDGNSSVSLLCQKLHLSTQEVIPPVCYLLFHHHLRMDLEEPFTTLVSLHYVERLTG